MRKAKEFILKMESPAAMHVCYSPQSPSALSSTLTISPPALDVQRRGWKPNEKPKAHQSGKPETPPPEPCLMQHSLTQPQARNSQPHNPAGYAVERSEHSEERKEVTKNFEVRYHQHSYRSAFKEEWTLKWHYIVRSSSGDPHVFFCEICKKTVSCAHQGLRDVTRHLESSGHLEKMNLTMKLSAAQEHSDMLSANLSLKALRDSGELSVVTTPPHDDESDQDVDMPKSIGSMTASSPPSAYAPLQATQALAAANGQLNPALKDVQCPICFKVFSRKFSLEMHFLIHQGLKPYTCQHCGRSFRQKGTLMRHKAIHSQTPSYRCGLCDRSYRQKNVFLHHLRTRHKISTDMLDRRRSKSGGQDDTGSPNSFLDGSGSPSGATETVYPPPEHSSSAATPVRPVSTEPVTSTLPGLPAFNPQIPLPSTPLQNPLFLPSLLSFPPLGFPPHPPQSVSPQNSWRCPFCPYETLNEDTEGCRKHLLQHIHESPYSCLACGQRCLNENELFLHIQDAHGAASNPVGLGSVTALQAAVNKCYRSTLPEQNEEQSEPLSLSRVKEEPFRKDMTFTCIPCKIDFVSEEDLECHAKTHVQSVLLEPANSAQVPEDLSVNSSRKRSIDSGSDSSSEATTHKSLKSDDSDFDHKKDEAKPKRQFLCVDCNKVFNSKHIYRYHVQMHISVAKCFRCGVCKIAFAKKHELLQHTRQTHMKKYSCGKCNKHFSYRSIYQRHEKDCDGQTWLEELKRNRGPHEDNHQKAGSLPLIDVSLATSALGRDLIGVIPLLGDEHQQGAKQNVLLGVPVINPSVLQTHQQFLKNLLVVRNMA